MKEKWNRFKRFMTDPTPENKYNKYFKLKTMYMRKVESNIFLLTLLAIGSFISDLYFMPVVIVLMIGWFIGWYYDAKFDRDFVNPLNKVNHILVDRYLELFKTNTDLSFELATSQGGVIPEATRMEQMLKTLKVNIDNWPVDKTSRWLGYIQRYLIEKEVVTVQGERDFSRPLFQNAYRELGYNIPESVTV